MTGPFRGTLLTNQAAHDEIQKILAMLPNEGSRKFVLWALLVNRCKTCLDYNCNPSDSCGSSYESRGG